MKKITLFIFLCLCLQLTKAQDTCSTAVVTEAGTTTVGTINGTDVPSPICSTGVVVPAGNNPAGEWYSYTPTQDYTVTVSSDLAINSGKDTRVHVYTGTCGNLTCLAGDDDAGVIGTGYLSIVTFNVASGSTYFIAWDNRWSASGFDFTLIEEPIVIPPTPPISFTQQSITSTSTICCVSDMNGDYLDDIVTIQNNQMTILTQLTTGGFSSTIYPLPGLTTLPSWSITAGDFDKNGFNDIVLGGQSRLTLIKANNTGTAYTEFPYPQNIFTQRANFIDIDNDGNLDLFACHDVAQSHAYRNDGAGNLIFDIPFFPTLAVGGNYASIWSDYDNDGDMDMYMAKCRGGAPAGDAQRINLLYQNNRISATPSLTYSEKGSSAGINDGAQSWSTAIEDFDNDGDMDFLLSNISDTNKLYKNNGDGTFTDIYAATGIDPQVGSWELQAADFDNDGFVDFFWQNGKEIYLNNKDLTFTGYDLSFSEGGIGDLNNDGFLDVQFGANIYYNNPNANNWIKINLQGVQSNRNGIGARVELYGAWGKQIREIRSGHGFSHQSTMNAHFGIGTETAISQAIIKWPSGTIDVINNPNANQALTVIEGSSPLSTTGFNTTEIEIYPNPSSDYITITNSEKLAIKTISIYSISGKLIKKIDEISSEIKISELQEGLYLLNLVTQNDEKYTTTFLKKN